MSFAISEDGTVYQKDLGEKTKAVAECMTEFNPDEYWNSASISAGATSRTQQ
jgi:hypothetical protein